MKLIFMGTPEFALPPLQALIDSPDHEIVAVYTQPPRPAGRGHKLRNTPVHDLAAANNIPVLTPTSLKDSAAQKEFKDFGADAAIVSAYGLLLPPEILSACPHGCINVHPSLLPRWRGAAPIQRPIIAGDTETGICIMQMDEGLDSGDILLQKTYEISPEATAGNLHDLLAKKSAAMVLEVLEQIENGTLKRQQQTEDGMTYAKKLNKDEGHIDFSKTVREIDCLIRGVTPWPGAYVMINDEKFKILAAECKKSAHQAPPGTTLDDALTIACADGVVIPTTIQRQGKKPMERQALLRGHGIASGTLIS